MKDLIITLAVDGREKYTEKLKGLIKTLIHWDGDIRVYKEFPSWCTPHNQIPYAFKYDLIKKAIADGYKRIFWLDSSIRLVPGKNISQLLDEAPMGIVAFHNLGHDLEPYINDTAINNLRIEKLAGVKQTWGGCVFYDFNKEFPNYVLGEVFRQIERGSFNDDATARHGFIGHRHDQAVLSWLFHTNEMPLLDYGVIAAKKDITEETFVQYGD